MAQNSENKACNECLLAMFTEADTDDKELIEAVKEIFTSDQLARAYVKAVQRNIELEKELEILKKEQE